jgi:hypothetical protein
MRAVLVLLAPLLLAGCASVSARGIVADADGRPIANASLAIRVGGTTVVAGASEGNGCFDLYQPLRRRPPSPVLLVEAPGYEPLAAPLEAGRAPLFVTLAHASSGGASAARAATEAEAARRFEPPCAPFVAPDATALGLR